MDPTISCVSLSCNSFSKSASRERGCHGAPLSMRFWVYPRTWYFHGGVFSSCPGMSSTKHSEVSTHSVSFRTLLVALYIALSLLCAGSAALFFWLLSPVPCACGIGAVEASPPEVAACDGLVVASWGVTGSTGGFLLALGYWWHCQSLSPYHNSIQPFSGGGISSGGSFVVWSSGLFSATVASGFGVVGSRPVFRLLLFLSRCDALRRASRRFSVVAGATGLFLFSWAWACSCCDCTSGSSLSGSVSLHVVVWMWRFWLDEGEHPSARLPSPSSPASYLNGCRPPV